MVSTWPRQPIQTPPAYASFQRLFTRPLRDGARPGRCRSGCPVDGAISQFGPIQQDQIFQAKGHSYSTTALVGGDAACCPFQNGHFATLYLSPRDYHCIHMPQTECSSAWCMFPGDLFSVNPTTARGVPGLFARNDGLSASSTVPRGPFVLVLGRHHRAAWHGMACLVNRTAPGIPRQWDYSDQSKSNCARATRWGVFCWVPPWSCCFRKGRCSSIPAGPQRLIHAWVKPLAMREPRPCKEPCVPRENIVNRRL